MKIARITLTGADERTDIDQLIALINQYPEVEIGLLYTATPEGRPRYPARAWLAQVTEKLSGRVAIHVCGRGARQELLSGNLTDLIRHAPRIQVNGLLDVEEVEVLAKMVGTLLTQHSDSNTKLLSAKANNHAVLIDSSGGRGITPEVWYVPETDKLVGFAGGIGPENLQQEYARIYPVCRTGAWTDMEGKLRVDEWFSVELATQCAAAHRAFNLSH